MIQQHPHQLSLGYVDHLLSKYPTYLDTSDGGMLLAVKACLTLPQLYCQLLSAYVLLMQGLACGATGHAGNTVKRCQ